MAKQCLLQTRDSPATNRRDFASRIWQIPTRGADDLVLSKPTYLPPRFSSTVMKLVASGRIWLSCIYSGRGGKDGVQKEP